MICLYVLCSHMWGMLYLDLDFLWKTRHDKIACFDIHIDLSNFLVFVEFQLLVSADAWKTYSLSLETCKRAAQDLCGYQKVTSLPLCRSTTTALVIPRGRGTTTTTTVIMQKRRVVAAAVAVRGMTVKVHRDIYDPTWISGLGETASKGPRLRETKNK